MQVNTAGLILHNTVTNPTHTTCTKQPKPTSSADVSLVHDAPSASKPAAPPLSQTRLNIMRIRLDCPRR
ncbi:hypothetical protein IF2G_08758 [Cordyceps javanica]|nr:hypothetical protein IF2G_08758 [Cordyceps javanica]